LAATLFGRSEDVCQCPQVCEREAVIFKFRALLIIAAVGVASAFCSEAGAEKGAIAQCDLKAPSADDSYLASEARRRCEELPENEFKFKKVFGPIDKPTQIELDVPVNGESIARCGSRPPMARSR
jgi:hypothetical protein